MIGRRGERGSGISVLAVRHDIYIYIYIPFGLMSKVFPMVRDCNIYIYIYIGGSFKKYREFSRISWHQEALFTVTTFSSKSKR